MAALALISLMKTTLTNRYADYLRTLLAEFEEHQHGQNPKPNQHDEEYRLSSALPAAILNLVPANSEFARQVNKATVGPRAARDAGYTCAQIGRAVMAAHDGGVLATAEDLIHAQTFEDYLAMAEYLHKETLLGPAAVAAGCALEQHLFHLCRANGIPLSDTRNGDEVPRKTNRLDDELVRVGVYDKTISKQVKAALAIRDDGAHGHWEKLTPDRVELLLSQCRTVMNSTSPAL